MKIDVKLDMNRGLPNIKLPKILNGNTLFFGIMILFAVMVCIGISQGQRERKVTEYSDKGDYMINYSTSPQIISCYGVGTEIITFVDENNGATLSAYNVKLDSIDINDGGVIPSQQAKNLLREVNEWKCTKTFNYTATITHLIITECHLVTYRGSSRWSSTFLNSTKDNTLEVFHRNGTYSKDFVYKVF